MRDHRRPETSARVIACGAIRPMRADDVPAMLQVQAQCYPAHMNESGDVFLARWQACPDTAWVLPDAHDQALAYLVAYRSQVGAVSPLGAAFVHAGPANALYLHDLAIGLGARGQGAAQALVAHACSQAQREGLGALSLVSVNESLAFWQRMGFFVEPVSATAQAHLDSYQNQAIYMLHRFVK